jgi:dipicolinate synthase subunit A
MKILVAGGDLRNRFLLSELRKDGYCAETFALDDGLREGIDVGEFDVIVGPIPFSRDGLNLYAPLHAGKVPITEFLDSIAKTATLFAGTLPESFRPAFRHVDLTKNAWLYDSNLVPTCEGIVQLILNNIDRTIAGATILVAGSGKVGRSIAAMLEKLGARVRVYSANEDELKEIAGGSRQTSIEELSDFEVIVNTIPAIVFTPGNLRTANEGTLLIDVASSPGGVDPRYAQEKRLAIIGAPGLPGKKAPRSVAAAMKEIIVGDLRDRQAPAGKAAGIESARSSGQR